MPIHKGQEFADPCLIKTDFTVFFHLDYFNFFTYSGILDISLSKQLAGPMPDFLNYVETLRRSTHAYLPLRRTLFSLGPDLIFSSHYTGDLRVYKLCRYSCGDMLLKWDKHHRQGSHLMGLALDHSLTIGHSEHLHLLYRDDNDLFELVTFSVGAPPFILTKKRAMRFCSTGNVLLPMHDMHDHANIIVDRDRLFISAIFLHPNPTILCFRLLQDTSGTWTATFERIIDVPDRVQSMVLLDDGRLMFYSKSFVYTTAV